MPGGLNVLFAMNMGIQQKCLNITTIVPQSFTNIVLKNTMPIGCFIIRNIITEGDHMKKLLAQYLAEFNDIEVTNPDNPPPWWLLFSLDAFLVGGLAAAVWWALK